MRNFKNKVYNILGIILIFSILISIISFVPLSRSNPDIIHPNMYLNINEITQIKNNVQAGKEPWKTAYNKLMADADGALSTPTQSVTFGGPTPPTGDNHDYYSPFPTTPNPDRHDYGAAIEVGKAVRNLGLAYAFTGDSKYANKAIQLIKAWTTDPSTKMNPRLTPGSNYIEYAITFPGMFYGADLIWNYNGWTYADKDAFKTWTASFISEVKRGSWCTDVCQNYENWRLVLVSSGAVISDDSNAIQYASDRWKELIGPQMDSQGRMVEELKRTDSLSYSLYAINAMIQTAEIVRHNGIDLYNYKLSDGRGLEKTLDYHAPYVANPSSWPYEQQNAYTGQNAALYELAHSFKNKDSYANVISKWGRPMYETRTMGPVTLTHADAYITMPEPTPTSSTPGPSPTPQPGTPVPTPTITPTPTPTPSPPQVDIGPIRVYCYKK